MFTYEAKPRAQVQADTEARLNPWPKGEYEFQIAEASQVVTGSGSNTPGVPMLKLTLNVYNDQGSKRTVYDNLISTYPDKIMGFCDAVGLEYGKPFSAEMLSGKSGRLGLKIQPAREYNGRSYDPSNAVSYYVAKKSGQATASTARKSAAAAATNGSVPPGAPTHELDDDIPF